jgi:aromatic ring hydroxylase
LNLNYKNLSEFQTIKEIKAEMIKTNEILAALESFAAAVVSSESEGGGASFFTQTPAYGEWSAIHFVD